ncbi:1-acyl-sn-glycerol-3-phosphate acyltransferase [Ameyamaea chiangmaiensis]|uniref:1-acyl-sn-glycerol-3-phosphate acyltransferase n=1 Tax=Ameyamaea chiangmaiensis TaxID=442969 RepID=A0A850PI70_9PROT|nr:lysophospholipid acyltransferase family protein [Ameyamaea chiangmaiensis]MBS4074455.1 1-acyl-sn-glycerol-3-phosphate acyltransferase [Ameyamaea chiangmaiensis]NVN41936.1 1-acyl-sn-glycerol-3-phosphate acyltransferase [Ameyamaea chiangmaiensis]
MVVLRACAFNVTFAVVTLVMGVVSLPLRAFARPWALGYAQLWTRVSLACLRALCGIEVRVSGLEHLPAGTPCVIASQHQSAFDTLVWMNLVPRPAYVMKRELTRLPLVGPMLLASGMIAVERTAGAKAMRKLLSDTREAAADARQIVIFPEGTRTRPGEIVPLQPGLAAMATHAHLPVVPVVTDSGHCWGRNAFIKRPGIIHIVIGAPIEATRERGALLLAVRNAWTRLEADNPVLTHVPRA